jgi:phosphate transport system substrate-binding protein
MNRLRLLLPLLALLGCGTPLHEPKAEAKSEPTPQQLVLTGSSTIAPLVTELAERYEQSHPGVQIDVQTGGSSRGVADARSGVANIGMVSRSLKPTEQDLTAFTLARDGIGMIVHRDNPVAGLSGAQVVAVYRGETPRWESLVPQQTGEVVVVNKAEGRSTLELFLDHFKLKGSDIKASVVIGDNEQGIKTVAGNPAAIGYVSIGSAEHAIASGVPIKLLPVDSAVPSRASVQAGTFPISRPLNLVIKGAASPLVQDFIRFAQSPAVHDLISKHAFVPASS